MKRILASLNPRLLRFLKYSAASVVSTVVSFGTLTLTFGALGWSNRAANIAAFCTGALVAFVINRLWAWQRRESAGVGRDFVRYWAVAIATALIALGVTSVADAYTRGTGMSHAVRTSIIVAAYFCSYAVTFGLKFLLLDRFVFRSPEVRSRAQVENTTRA